MSIKLPWVFKAQDVRPPSSSPVVEKHSVPVDLVLQGEVEGEVLNAFAVVDLHPGGVLIGLEMFDDIGEPHRKPVEPAHTCV